MTGSGGVTDGKLWYVVEWEEGDPTTLRRVWDWHDWVEKPPLTRPENAVMVIAKDPLDAYLKTLRGEVYTF